MAPGRKRCRGAAPSQSMARRAGKRGAEYELVDAHQQLAQQHRATNEHEPHVMESALRGRIVVPRTGARKPFSLRWAHVRVHCSMRASGRIARNRSEAACELLTSGCNFYSREACSLSTWSPPAVDFPVERDWRESC